MVQPHPRILAKVKAILNLIADEGHRVDTSGNRDHRDTSVNAHYCRAVSLPNTVVVCYDNGQTLGLMAEIAVFHGLVIYDGRYGLELSFKVP